MVEVAVHPAGQIQAEHAARVMAAIAFWLMAVLFVANVAVLNGWLGDRTTPAPPQANTVAESPAPTPLPTPTPTEGPVTVEYADSTVEFPAPVARSTQELDVAGAAATLTLHSATDEEATTFNLGVIDYPPAVDLTDPAVNLLASVSGAAGTAGGRIVEQDVTVFQGEPAVTFRIETPTVRLAGRNVLVDRRLYAQNVAYRGVNDPPAAKAFFDSFSLTGED